MIDLKWLEAETNGKKENLELYKNNVINRGGDGGLVDEIYELQLKRKQTIQLFETKKAEQNTASKDFAKAKKEGTATQELIEQMQELSKQVKDLDAQSAAVQAQVNEKLAVLPNMVAQDVPVGKSEEDNMLVKEWGAKPQLSFDPKEHWELGEKSGTLDFERASKISGARYAILRKGAALLERALINYMLNKHTQKHGYEEIFPPLLVQSEALYGTSQFPKFREDVFKIEGQDSYLIPTGEVPLTNIFSQEILSEGDLPVKLAAYTPCFRSEAGSYGKDTRGLIRQHQFNKVEIVKFTHPEESQKEHEALLADAESILQDLELHYQVVSLCTGDIGFGAKKCFDINVWLPGQNSYREISSCSNFGDFQARRANIRFRPGEKGKPQFVHTLNGSGLAVGRTLIAVFENYQNEDGTISIPEVLWPYTNGLKLIDKI